jgi:flagella synthesis protein FlgN
METLQTTLNKLQETLNELEAILAEEIKQLSYAQVNPVALQQLSDTKSRLLSTVAYYDEQRKQEETRLRLPAPYVQQTALATRWERLQQSTRKASEMNQQTSHLLNMHMQKVRNLSQVMDKAAASPTLYTAGGQSDDKGKARAYNITI